MKIKYRRCFMGTPEYRKLIADGWALLCGPNTDNVVMLTRIEG